MSSVSISSAKLRKGRYYPLSSRMVRDFVNSNEHLSKSEEVEVRFANPRPTADRHRFLVEVEPFHKLVLYSLPENVIVNRYEELFVKSIQRIAKVCDRGVKQSHRLKSFLVTLGEDSQSFVVALRETGAKQQKYRASQKFSNAFKPMKISTTDHHVEVVRLDR